MRRAGQGIYNRYAHMYIMYIFLNARRTFTHLCICMCINIIIHPVCASCMSACTCVYVVSTCKEGRRGGGGPFPGGPFLQGARFPSQCLLKRRGIIGVKKNDAKEGRGIRPNTRCYLLEKKTRITIAMHVLLLFLRKQELGPNGLSFFFYDGRRVGSINCFT